MALTGGERKAISRALELGGAAAVRRLRYGVYAVASASRPGVVHTVTVDGAGTWACTCEAGRRGRVCWHAAATWLAKLEHTSRVRVTGPGTRPTRPPSPTSPALANSALPRAA
jgi:hypothetical protein